jgi:hypothetical protein
VSSLTLAGLAGLGGGLLLLFSCLWCSYLVALRLAGEDAPASARLSATAIVAAWLLALLFYLLCLASAFRLGVVLVVWPLLAVLAHLAIARRRPALRLLGADLSRAAGVLADFARSPLRFLGLACALLALARLARGLVAPPLAWDTLVYHLLKAGRWVQAGTLTPERAPDTWAGYEHYPPVGDLLWSWFMLPVRGDALVAPAGFFVLGACLLGVYASARALGARERPATLAALAVAFTPAVLNFVTSAYVNNTVLALVTLGTVFVARSIAAPSAGNAALALGALGLAAGTQLSAVPLLGLTGLFVWAALLLPGSRLPLGKRLAGIAASLGAAALALPSYLRALVETGSPLYPFPLVAFGRTLLPGEPETTLLFAQSRPLPHLEFLRVLFYKRFFDGWEHLNFGVMAPPLIAFGLGAAAWLLCRRRAREDRAARAAVLFLLGTFALLVLGLFSPSMAGQRSLWAPVAGRFVTPALAAVVVLGVAVNSPIGSLLCVAAVAVDLAYGLPLGWSAEDLKAMTDLAVPLFIGLALATEAAAALFRRGRPVAGVVAAALLLVLPVGTRLFDVRARHRYPIYAAAARSRVDRDRFSRSYDVHGIYRSYAAVHPIWKLLDDGPPHRIAASAGFDKTGHPWYRYPLLGSRLQNEVFYVPVTRDGSIVNARDHALLVRKGDPEAWLRRLVDLRIEFFVALHPSPLEESWARARKDRFVEVASGEERMGHAYRFYPSGRPPSDRLPLRGR